MRLEESGGAEESVAADADQPTEHANSVRKTPENLRNAADLVCPFMLARTLRTFFHPEPNDWRPALSGRTCITKLRIVETQIKTQPKIDRAPIKTFE